MLDGGTFTHDVFYLFKGYDKLLVLDIVHAGGKPGSLYRLTEEQLVHKESRRLSIHDIDLLDSLRMPNSCMVPDLKWSSWVWSLPTIPRGTWSFHPLRGLPFRSLWSWLGGNPTHAR